MCFEFEDDFDDLSSGFEPEERFLSREEDPIGDWEHSPDGENILVFKPPIGAMPRWARWAKRLVKKFGLPFRQAFRFASWAYQVQGGLPEDVKSYWENEIARRCPSCGHSRIPAILWAGTPYCPHCGDKKFTHGFKWVEREEIGRAHV